jgi:hypothetical protein
MKIRAIYGRLILIALFARPVLAAKAPFSIHIAAIHNPAPSGHVQIASTITNISNREITLHMVNQCDYSMDVHDEHGKFRPETLFKQNLDCSHPGSLTGRNMIIVLKPQESTSEEVSASELFDMTNPGEYTVRVSRNVSVSKKDGVVKSNKIVVSVIR